MQELLKALDKGLSWLPFNNHKTNIGSLIGWLGVADVFLQASLPLLHTAAPYVPPMYVVAVGAGITGIGAFHKFVKGLLEAQKK